MIIIAVVNKASSARTKSNITVKIIGQEKMFVLQTVVRLKCCLKSLYCFDKIYYIFFFLDFTEMSKYFPTYRF